MEPHQLRAARALLGWKVTEMAERSGVNKNTIVNIENGGRPHAATAEKLKKALIAYGIVFIGEMAPFHKSTVAFRYDMELPKVGTQRRDDGEVEDDSGLDARAWDETEVAENAERTEAMRDYLREHPDEWQRLSSPSRKTLERALGGTPFA